MNPTRTFGSLLILLLLGCLLLMTALVANDHSISVIAGLICLVTAIPVLLERRVDMFSPWTYMFYFVVLNVLVRQVFIDFELDGGITDIEGIFYLGKTRSFMVESTAVLLLGFVLLTLGYLATSGRPQPLRFRIFQCSDYAPRRFRLAVTVMLLASGLAFIAFFKLTFTSVGDFAIEALSRHRGLSEDITEYRAYGYLRLVIGLSNLVVYLSYVWLRTQHTRRGYYRLMLTLGVLVSVSMAFYTQGRAALVFTFLNILFIKYYLDERRFPWRAFGFAAPVLVALFIVTSSFRGGSGVDLTGGVTPMTVVAPIVLNNGGIDASKTGQVIAYTDANQDYQFGQTLIQFLWAAVPRQVWLNKPPNLDTYVGEHIYGAETFGASAVPPGFFAEMYMNYWYAGIVIGAIALGAVMKRINALLVANRCNPNFVVFYVVVLQSFGLSALGSGVSSTVMGVLMSGVPLVVVLNYVTTKRTRPVSLPAPLGATA